MSAVLWMNIPLMVLAFGLMTGIPLWLVLRREDWHLLRDGETRLDLAGLERVTVGRAP